MNPPSNTTAIRFWERVTCYEPCCIQQKKAHEKWPLKPFESYLGSKCCFFLLIWLELSKSLRDQAKRVIILHPGKLS